MPTLCKTNSYPRGDCILKEHQQPRLGWILIPPLVKLEGMEVIHEDENHDHQRNSNL